MSLESVVPIEGTDVGSESAARVADVLLLLTDSAEPLGVTRLAKELGVAKSMVHRILRSLASRSLVEQPPGLRTYRLGAAAVAIGARALSRADLERVVAPYLEDLRDKTKETALLSRPVAGGRVHVAQYESRQTIRMTVELGAFRPWHAGASGKVLLAYSEPEFRERAIAQEAELYGLDDQAIETLYRELERAQQEGFAVSGGERNPDAGAIAAPVLGVGNVAIGAISVCGPLSRFYPAEAEKVAPLLLSVARKVSAKMQAQRQG